MDQGPPHKNRYNESNGRESGEDPIILEQRRNFPEHNTNGLCFNINNQQMEPHKIEKQKNTVNRTK